MEEDMYEDDADLIEQVSDDDDEHMDDENGRQMDDEPPLEGYERYVMMQ